MISLIRGFNFIISNIQLPYKVIDGKIETLNFTAEQTMMKLKDEEIKFLDLQFTGLTGRFHHTTMAANMFNIEDFEYGLPKLDGSSIRGFTDIHESDLIIRPRSINLCYYSMDNKR